jgi:hypothetical protein
MNRTPSLFLDEAAAAFIATRDPEAPSTLSYRTTFRELQRSFPGTALETFEPPPGTTLIRNFLDAKPRAAETHTGRNSGRFGPSLSGTVRPGTSAETRRGA